MHAEVKVKLLVFITFLTNYTHLLKTKIVTKEINISNILRGLGLRSTQWLFYNQFRKYHSNALHAKGLTIIKTKKILNLIHSTANKNTASVQPRPLKFDKDILRT